MNRRWVGLGTLAAAIGLAFSAAGAPAVPQPPASNRPVPIETPLGGAEHIELQPQPDGSFRYLVIDGPNPVQSLTPDQFAQQLYRDYTSRSWLDRVLNISSPIGIAWVSLGFLGQLLFAGRMVVQWLASERNSRSVVPEVFWWMSLVGSAMLLAYFGWRKDIVGVSGQTMGSLIYVRNLVLIHRSRAAPH